MTTTSISSFVGLVALAATTACDPAEDAAGDAGTVIAYPATCAELLATSPALPDADYPLYVKNEPTKPWTAYCQGMESGTPVEYLTLKRVGGNYNFSRVAFLGGAAVRSDYQRVRIDPIGLRLDLGDGHATHAGSVVLGGQPVESVPLGVAASCATGTIALQVGVDYNVYANIDLTGTRFAVADAFCVHQANGGGATESTDGGRVDLVVGTPSSALVTERCGWVAPDPCPVNPWRMPDGSFLLDVVYAPALGQSP